MNKLCSFIVLVFMCTQVVASAFDEHESVAFCFNKAKNLSLGDIIPVAEDDSFTTDEDTELTADVSDNGGIDPDFTYTVSTDVGNGILTLNADGTFTYTPNENFFGTDVFTYTVCNLLNECDEAIVTILVNEINDSPIAGDDLFEADFNGSLTASVAENDFDPDGDELVYTLDESTQNGGLVFNTDGSFTYTPDADFEGQDSFTYTVCDSENECAGAMVSLIIINAEEMPIAVDDDYTIDEDTELTGNVGDNDSDPEGEELTFSVVIDANNGTFTLDSEGSFTYVPITNYAGQDTVIYSVCDPTDHCVLGMVVITIVPVNDAPNALDDEVVGEQNDILTNNVSANDYDVDGDVLTYSLVSDVANGTLTFNSDGSFTYNPNVDFFGNDTFEYEACDAELCDTAVVSIVIDQAFANPIAIDDTYSTDEGTGISGNVSDNDGLTDVGDVTYTVSDGVNNGVLVLNEDGSFTYNPNTGFFGTDVFEYSVCNENNNCDEAIVTIQVNELHTLPIAVNDTLTVTEDGFLLGSVVVNDSDADGDDLIFTLEIDVAFGTLVLNADGTFTYTPNPNFFGTDTFVYTVCDDDGNCDMAIVIITVTPINDTPGAVDDLYTTFENQSVSGSVGINDVDIDGVNLVFTVSDNPDNGMVVMNPDGTFTYNPNPDFSGTDSFTYTVCDTGGLCDAATVTIEVLPVEEPQPVAVLDQFTTNEDEALSGDVSINDINLDGYIYSVLSEPSNGTVIMNEDGTFTYMPNQDFNGFDEFVYQACDMIGTCYNATVNIIIVPQPDDVLEIPLGFSPNGDGTNDKFSITNIDSYPNNKLSIFNRWGNIVYEKAPYTAATEWDGTTDSGGVSFGSMVPEGTYFYVLDTGPSTLNGGKAEKKSGYIVVKYESK